MLESTDKLYAAFKSKDPRFDGKFFVGISSTGIYCRPICHAKLPKEENCKFYKTASLAEVDGYRPCLLCRPELSPGNSIVDSSVMLAKKATILLEKYCGNDISIERLSEMLGCSDRHLRRVFEAEYNVSPIQYLQTHRLLLSKSLLTDTSLPIIDVAMASGFGSLRRFNDLFKTKYDLTPSGLRKNMSKEKNNDIILKLNYRPPYLWDEMLSFLKLRAIKGIEVIKDNEYMRTVHLVTLNGKDIYGWLKVSNNSNKNCLNITISETLLIVLPEVLSKLKNLFDLYCDPYIIYEALTSMNDIKTNSCVLGTRLPGSFDPFEMSVRAILGQQITVKAASTLASRIVNAYGMLVDTGIEGLTHVFPSAKDIYDLENIEEKLGVLGIISSRSRTIYALAEAVVNNEICFDLYVDYEAEIKKLMKIKGIGSWTAKYIAMRTMGWTDSFLETDIGIKKALFPYSEKEMISTSEKWKPWRSYATINLWNTL